MGIKIVKNPKGKFARDIDIDFGTRKYVDIIYQRRGKLGRIINGKTKKRINAPKGFRIKSIENNAPKVGSVKITFTSNKRIIKSKVKGRR